MIDSHAHLYFDRFADDREAVVQRAREAGVEIVINIGIDVETSRDAIDLARAHKGFYAAVGLHPTSQIAELDPAVEEIDRLATEHTGRVVAIGEIGLDYYWKDVSPDVQKPRLQRQLDLAGARGLPVIFHCRDALEDLLTLLENKESLPPGVFHCFSGGPEEARRALALGYHVSFAGNVTYPKATKLQEAAQVVPLDRLLLETDSPFLSPQPQRGKRNEPAFVKHCRDFLAALKQVTPEDLEQATDAATKKLFGLG